MRTIFLLIRGINQTGMAFGDVSKGLQTIEERQKALAQSGYRLLFAGAAFMAFGAMAAGALMGVIAKSTAGARIMDDFGKAMDRFQRGLSEAILKNYGEEIKRLLKTITDWTTNPQALDITAQLAVKGITGTIGLGGALLAFGGLKLFLSALLPYLGLESAAGVAAIGALGEIIVPIIIALMVKDFIWTFFPDQAKIWDDFWAALKPKGLTLNANGMINFDAEYKSPLQQWLDSRNGTTDNGGMSNGPSSPTATVNQTNNFYGVNSANEIADKVKDTTIDGIINALGANP
jgi:amino acid transporter